MTASCQLRTIKPFANDGSLPLYSGRNSPNCPGLHRLATGVDPRSVNGHEATRTGKRTGHNAFLQERPVFCGQAPVGHGDTVAGCQSGSLAFGQSGVPAKLASWQSAVLAFGRSGQVGTWQSGIRAVWRPSQVGILAFWHSGKIRTTPPFFLSSFKKEHPYWPKTSCGQELNDGIRDQIAPDLRGLDIPTPIELHKTHTGVGQVGVRAVGRLPRPGHHLWPKILDGTAWAPAGAGGPHRPARQGRTDLLSRGTKFGGVTPSLIPLTPDQIENNEASRRDPGRPFF